MLITIKFSDLQGSTDAILKTIFQREFGDECVLTDEMIERIVRRNLMYDMLPFIPGMNIEGFKSAMGFTRTEYYNTVRPIFERFEAEWRSVSSPKNPYDLGIAQLMEERDIRVKNHFDEQLPKWIQTAQMFVADAMIVRLSVVLADSVVKSVQP